MVDSSQESALGSGVAQRFIARRGQVARRVVRVGAPAGRTRHHRGAVPAGEPFRARGYADVMAVCGYANPDHLWPTVLGWDGLLDALRPNVIVADYAPLLALAAHGRVPLVAVGDGFVLPPTHGATFPVLREGTRMAGEPAMLDHARAVQARRGLTAPKNLPALIGGAAAIVSTYPESDVYAGARPAPALGPIEAGPAPLPPPRGPALFVYLAADFPHTAKLLQLVLDARAPALGVAALCVGVGQGVATILENVSPTGS